MDKAKILRTCNEIEMIMCEVYNTGHMMQNCDYESVDRRLKAIEAEITAPPKSNADRIRQMTDEELAEWLTDGHEQCDFCAQHLCDFGSDCVHGVLKWLKQEVKTDDER